MKNFILLSFILILTLIVPTNLYSSDITSYFEAIQKGDQKDVEKLLSSGIDINSQDINGNTGLNYAILKNKIDMAKQLIEKGIDINLVNNDKESPLINAAYFNKLEIVKILIENNAELNLQDKSGNTALHHALDKDKIDIINLLIKKGIDINLVNNNKKTALINAAESNELEIVKILIENNAKLDGNTVRFYSKKNILKLFPKTEKKSCESKEKISKLLSNKKEYHPIEGAFGLKLGDKFKPKRNRRNSTTTSGETIYYFKPSKKFRKFREYYVLITPETKKIYQIWAIAKISEEQKFLREQEIILNILEKKYGPATNGSNNFRKRNTKIISNGYKYIVLKYEISAFGNSAYLMYVDQELEIQAKKEYMDIELAKEKNPDI
jgi:hypothetical protein